MMTIATSSGELVRLGVITLLLSAPTQSLLSAATQSLGEDHGGVSKALSLRHVV